MFAHLKRLLEHSVVYGLSETISRGTGFILLFIYVRILDDTEIGIRSLAYAGAGFVALFYTLGLDMAFLRYFMDSEYADKKDSVLSTAQAFTVVMGLLFLTGVFLFDSEVSQLITKSPENTYIIRLIFTILIFDTLVIYPSLVLRAENRLYYFSFISLCRFVLIITLNIILVWFLDRDLHGVFEANLISVIVIAVLLVPVNKEYLSRRISYDILKKMLQFGIPAIFTLFFLRIIDYSDRYIIAYYFGESGTREVGRYAPAYTLGMVGIMVFVNSFRLAWQPFFLSVKDNPDAKRLFSKVATYYAVIIGMVFLGVTLFRGEIFYRYTSGKYPATLAGIIPYVALAYILYGFYFIMVAGVFIRKKTIYLPLAPITGAALNIGFNFLFIPRYGIIGAAYTTIIAYLAMVVILFVISRKIYHVQYEYYRLAVVFFITAGLIAVSLGINVEPGILQLLFNGALCVLPPIIYWNSGFFTPVEKDRARATIKGWFTK